MRRNYASTRVLAAFLVTVLSVPGPLWGWGKIGHATVADIAEAHLTPKAAAEVHRLLAVEGARHMSDISLWADGVKGQPGSPSHTIRLPIDGTDPGPHPCPGHFCADDALTMYGAVLADRSKPVAEREVALKYIVHLVGDMQQPLHGTNATGGMKVLFQGQETTLHSVWDDGIIDAHTDNDKRLAVQLIKKEKGVAFGGGPADWAHEDLEIAQQDIYSDVFLHPKSLVVLPADYATVKWPIVEQRLTQGGLRLARLLNDLLR